MPPLVTYADMEKLGTIAKAYLWDVVFASLPVPGAPADLRARARRVSIPTRDFAPLIDPFQGLEIVDTGAPTYSHECNILFTETEEGVVANIIEAWLDLSYNPETGVAKKKPDRVVRMNLSLYNDEGNPYRVYQLINVQPRNNSAGAELSYEVKDGKIEYQVVFLFDYYKKIM